MKYSKIKRLLDIFMSFILIIITLPIMIVVSIITLINIGRPLIDIRIPREGKNKKPFYMYKIRTRVYDEFGSHYTKVSKFIDKTGLNELPQLFNVLKGEMSLIGPRAFICGEKLPKGNISEKRYLMKPGISGLAQVSGGRRLSFEKTLEYDVIYYDNMSFLLDLKIFFKTIIVVIKNIFS